ncbi:hypothetical protein CDIK_3231 [Cucumispora dikerogammari]|nr:hypothetical protein CDIK_3231 [Cucumispora dikerogammari]
MHQIDKAKMKNFIEKYTSEKSKKLFILSKATITIIYSKKYKEIIETFDGKLFYIIFDETTDVQNRAILNILVCICAKYKRSSLKLIRSLCLSSTNLQNIIMQLIGVLNEVYVFDISSLQI